MNNWNPAKAITIISFIAAIGGLLTILAPVFMIDDEPGFPTWRIVITALFQNVYFNFFDRDLLQWWVGGNTRIAINVADLLFYLVFLIGAITFLINGFRNARIIGFCFSVVFFTQCVSVLLMCYNVVKRSELLKMPEQVMWFILYLVTTAAWIWLSYYVLKNILKHRALSVERYEGEGEPVAFFCPAGKGQRFVHMLVDRVIIILMCSTWAYFFSSPLEMIENTLGTRETIMVYYIVGMLVYYPFFEGILGATPAKFLTANRVADELGRKPAFGYIMIRTFSRLVPFDALSFLGDRGWHDSWSNTYVLNDDIGAAEENTFSFEEKK
jgi:hypothetical protein